MHYFLYKYKISIRTWSTSLYGLIQTFIAGAVNLQLTCFCNPIDLYVEKSISKVNKSLLILAHNIRFRVSPRDKVTSRVSVRVGFV